MNKEEIMACCCISKYIFNRYFSSEIIENETDFNDAYIRENSLAISLEKKGFTLPNIRKDLILDKNEQDNYERMLLMLQSKRQIVLDKVHDEEQYLSELDYLIFNLRKLQK